MSSTQQTPDAAPQLRRLRIDQIDLSNDRRPLDETNVQRLTVSIREHGLLQPIGVAAVGDRFQLAYGNHRLAAMRQSGALHIDAYVWPAGSSPDAMLLRSLHENQVRKDETLDDILRRVSVYQGYHHCEFEEATRLAVPQTSQRSKIRKVVKRLSPAAMEFALANKVGLAIAYEVAFHSEDDAQQLRWLRENIAGTLTRDQIAASGKKDTQPKKKEEKFVSVNLVRDGVRVLLEFPPGTEYSQILDALRDTTKEVKTKNRQNIPSHLLGEVMA